MLKQSFSRVAFPRGVAVHIPVVLLGLLLIYGTLSGCGGDESGLETFTEPVPAEGATEIADHPDTKAETDVVTMIPWDDAKQGWVGVKGSIIGVYSDGARKIEIWSSFGYTNREGTVIEGKFIHPGTPSVVFRYKKLTKAAWAKLHEDEKWAEVMEGYIAFDEFWSWNIEQRLK